jgi:hypothetical protein
MLTIHAGEDQCARALKSGQESLHSGRSLPRSYVVSLNPPNLVSPSAGCELIPPNLVSPSAGCELNPPNLVSPSAGCSRRGGARRRGSPRRPRAGCPSTCSSWRWVRCYARGFAWVSWGECTLR